MSNRWSGARPSFDTAPHKPGDMRLRWAAAGMLAASTQFRRVKGYRQLPTLAHALRHTVGAHTDQSPVAVTA
jgi:hypothetical protein